MAPPRPGASLTAMRTPVRPTRTLVLISGHRSAFFNANLTSPFRPLPAPLPFTPVHTPFTLVLTLFTLVLTPCLPLFSPPVYPCSHPLFTPVLTPCLPLSTPSHHRPLKPPKPTPPTGHSFVAFPYPLPPRDPHRDHPYPDPPRKTPWSETSERPRTSLPTWPPEHLKASTTDQHLPSAGGYYAPDPSAPSSGRCPGRPPREWHPRPVSLLAARPA